MSDGAGADRGKAETIPVGTQLSPGQDVWTPSVPPGPAAAVLRRPERASRPPSLSPPVTRERWVGRYKILASLGSGAMAEVFLGSVDSIGGFERRFAIKVVHRRLLKDRQFVDMLLDEARIAGLVNHANVVSVHDVHHSGDQLYLVMDYVEGVTLAELAKSLWQGGGVVPIEITFRIALDVLSALEAIHDLRDAEGHLLDVVHRDVSPRNILVGVDGVCRLTDFGIARAQGRLTETPEGVLKGTLGYVSPEAITGRSVDLRADLYSLGVILWELLARRRLFGAAGGRLRPTDPRLATPARTVEDPLLVNPDIPRGLADVCLKALEPEPTQRYSSAAEMGTAIEDAMNAAGIRDVGPRLTGRLVSALERMKRMAAKSRPSAIDP